MSKSKGSKNSQYKIRLIVTKNKTGDVYGITIPQNIAKNFLDSYFQIEVVDKLPVIVYKGDIIFHSGCDIREAAKKENFDSFTTKKTKVLSLK